MFIFSIISIFNYFFEVLNKSVNKSDSKSKKGDEKDKKKKFGISSEINDAVVLSESKMIKDEYENEIKKMGVDLRIQKVESVQEMSKMKKLLDIEKKKNYVLLKEKKERRYKKQIIELKKEIENEKKKYLLLKKQKTVKSVPVKNVNQVATVFKFKKQIEDLEKDKNEQKMLYLKEKKKNKKLLGLFNEKQINPSQQGCNVNDLSDLSDLNGTFSKEKKSRISKLIYNYFKRNSPLKFSFFYKKNHYLDFYQKIDEILFIDGGSKKKIFPVEKYMYKRVIKREIIVVNLSKDKRLFHFIKNLKKNCKILSKQKSKVTKIIGEVRRFFGGNFKEIEKKSNQEIWKLQRKKKTNVIKLGDIRFGVARHRSLLFKLACDTLNIKCRLIRGFLGLESSEIAREWNLIELDGEMLMVDTMDNSKFVSEVNYANYKRIGGSLGMSICNLIPFDRSGIQKIDVLGKGSFGTVFKIKAKNLRSREVEILAMKVINKSKFNIIKEQFENEIIFMKFIKHPNLMELKDEFVELNKTEKGFIIENHCILMDLMNYDGKKLLKKLRTFSDKVKVLRETFIFFFGIVQGLKHLHDNRDLKPANILLEFNENENKIVSVKIADFGAFQIKEFKEQILQHANVYSPEYVGPEVSHGKIYDERADIYSVGKIMDDYKEFFEDYNDVVDLKNRCLNIKPENRPKLEEIIFKIISFLNYLSYCNV